MWCGKYYGEIGWAKCDVLWCDVEHFTAAHRSITQRNHCEGHIDRTIMLKVIQ